MTYSFCLLCVTALVIAAAVASSAEEYTLRPVGTVIKQNRNVILQVQPAYEKALLGLDRFSHVIVLYWFDRNDTSERRSTLRVHPRSDPRNPLTGVFATRSPVRPNLIGLTVCRIKSVEGRRILVDKIDALDRSPILDLKPYIPGNDCVPDAETPKWLKRSSGQ